MKKYESMECKELDMRGQICPSALLMALREINRNKSDLKSGSLTLVLLTDNRDSTITIPESAAMMGYEAHVIKVEGYYRIEICASSGCA